MEIIMSALQPGVILHYICRLEEMQGRKNLVEGTEFLQVSSLKIADGESFQAHRHIWKALKVAQTIAQESWVVIAGKIEVTFFDLDDSLISKHELSPGDCSITLQGGHSYTAIGESLVYEFKSGPYEGQANDKVMIAEVR